MASYGGRRPIGLSIYHYLTLFNLDIYQHQSTGGGCWEQWTIIVLIDWLLLLIIDDY